MLPRGRALQHDVLRVFVRVVERVRAIQSAVEERTCVLSVDASLEGKEGLSLLGGVLGQLPLRGNAHLFRVLSDAGYLRLAHVSSGLDEVFEPLVDGSRVLVRELRA